MDIRDFIPMLDSILEKKKCSINIHKIENDIVISIKERFKRKFTIKGNIKSEIVADLSKYCLIA